MCAVATFHALVAEEGQCAKDPILKQVCGSHAWQDAAPTEPVTSTCKLHVDGGKLTSSALNFQVPAEFVQPHC